MDSFEAFGPLFRKKTMEPENSYIIYVANPGNDPGFASFWIVEMRLFYKWHVESPAFVIY